MVLLSKTQFKELMKLYPEDGIVFAENPCETDVLVTDGDFGTRSIIPQNGGVLILIGILKNAMMVISSMFLKMKIFFKLFRH